LPDTVRFEFELEDNELEIELKWEKTTPSSPRSEPTREPAATTSSQAPRPPAGTAASSPSSGDEPVNYGLAGQASDALVTTASQSSSQPSGDPAQAATTEAGSAVP
jgi:hypothetical protein